MRTYRYGQPGVSSDVKFRQKHFSMSCEAVGYEVRVTPVMSVDYSTQGEPDYTRGGVLEGFCHLDTSKNRKKLINSGWMQEDDELVPILALIPVMFDYELETNIDLSGLGHLVELPSYYESSPISPEVWIVTKSKLNDDQSHWIVSLAPYREDLSDESPKLEEGVYTPGFLT